MSVAVDKIFEETQKLSIKEKAELAAQLISDMDSSVDKDFENLWQEEILRRDQMFSSGEEDGIDWEDIREQYRQS